MKTPENLGQSIGYCKLECWMGGAHIIVKRQESR